MDNFKNIRAVVLLSYILGEILLVITDNFITGGSLTFVGHWVLFCYLLMNSSFNIDNRWTIMYLFTYLWLLAYIIGGVFLGYVDTSIITVGEFLTYMTVLFIIGWLSLEYDLFFKLAVNLFLLSDILLTVNVLVFHSESFVKVYMFIFFASLGLLLSCDKITKIEV